MPAASGCLGPQGVPQAGHSLSHPPSSVFGAAGRDRLSQSRVQFGFGEWGGGGMAGLGFPLIRPAGTFSPNGGEGRGSPPCGHVGFRARGLV